MNDSQSWSVHPDRFPFGVAPETLGVVTGVDRADALAKAIDLYGRHVVVQRASPGPKGPDAQRVSSHADNRALPSHIGSPRRERSAVRPMTADEAEMARSLACLSSIRRHPRKGFVRELHSRGFRADRSISTIEAAILRTLVREFAADLPERILVMAGPFVGGAP